MKALFRGFCIVLLLSTLVFASAVGVQQVPQAQAGKLFKAGCTPPTASGDWMIADSETCGSQTITVTGNVIIKNGGSLTLQGTTLKISPPADCNTGITVEQGGKLYVQQASILTSAGKRFLIQANDGSTLEVTNSELTNCGCGGGLNCLTDYAANSVFSNNNVHDNKGMIVFAGGNAVVSQNTFSKNDEGVGFGRMKGGNTFNLNTASNSAYGVEFGGGSGNNVIQGNTLTNNQYGLYICCGGSNNKVSGNHANNNAKKGILAVASSTEFSGNEVRNNGGNGIEVSGGSNSFKQNTVWSNQGHGILALLADNEVIQDNDVENNALDGIRLSNPNAGNVVKHNTVKGQANGAGIRVEATFVETNYAQTNPLAYAAAGGTQTTFTQNTVQNNGDGLLVYTDWVNKNVVITNDNTILNNARFGVVLADAVINADFDYKKIGSNGEGKIMKLWSGRADVDGTDSKQKIKDCTIWLDGITADYKEPHPYNDYFDQSLHYPSEKVKTNVYWVFADGTSTWFTQRLLLWEYYVKNDNSVRNNNPHTADGACGTTAVVLLPNPDITAPWIYHLHGPLAAKQASKPVASTAVTPVSSPNVVVAKTVLVKKPLAVAKQPIKPVASTRVKTSS